MWDYIQEGEIDVAWISVALTTGMFIGVTDGSYDQVYARAISGSRWILCCSKTNSSCKAPFMKPHPKPAHTGKNC
jgi:hypothetical protein